MNKWITFDDQITLYDQITLDEQITLYEQKTVNSQTLLAPLLGLTLPANPIPDQIT